MFYPIKDGSVEHVNEYKCQLPTVGYGKNRLTGELEYVGVIKRSNKKEEQYWERIALPKDWDKKEKLEMEMQKGDANYYDPELEKIREKHWRYRLCGLWVMINGVATYIPCSFYFYLNWCPLDIGYPDYWESDRRFFYVWEYCVEDPYCGGMIDIEGRRSGKTFKAGSILLDRASLFKNHHAGIQSKTTVDCKGIFQKTIISFFKKLPSFFRPVFDESQGVTPKSELRFFKTNIKGRKALNILGGVELESWIDFGSHEPLYYDGTKLNTYFMDEYGKTEESSVWDRWECVKFCLMDKGKWIGKAILTSTIEEQDNRMDDPKKLWEYSDPEDKNANGRTKSGLYRYFVPSYERPMMNGDEKLYDNFGKPDKEKTIQYILNEREGVRDDPRSLSALIRKMPMSIVEAFRINAATCLYDDIKLNDQLDRISWKDNLTEKGSFAWKDGEPFTEIVWEKSKTGRFEMCSAFVMKDANKVLKQNERYTPNNNLAFAAGVDPFKYDKVADNRRSDCAAFIYKKRDSGDPNNIFNDAFVCKYTYRAPTTAIQYDDIIKMLWFFGCQALFERNVDSFKEYFKAKNCQNFLMWLPGETEPGLYSDGHGNMIQSLSDYTEAYINEFIEKVFFKDLIKDWLEFDVGKTTKFDRAIGAGMALIATKRHQPKQYQKKSNEVTDYFKVYRLIGGNAV
ncbi:MAG TPA: hypothetical protein VGZ90_13290 [Puia sp.]|jgi:hypothetical protein|nr:hypothetical protein [Puia sp.]